VDQGAWRLEGIRMCTSHRLDRMNMQLSITFLSLTGILSPRLSFLST
jgi:hypothetical protein